MSVRDWLLDLQKMVALKGHRAVEPAWALDTKSRKA